MIRKNLQKIIIFALLAIPFVSFAGHYVITSNATNITMNSAKLNGTVTSDHGINSAKFRYSTTPPLSGGTCTAMSFLSAWST
jgi:formate-dependent phosphoribosylglycinamide formyltransferase (GAR transformylase)